jgi:hypothetical protein
MTAIVDRKTRLEFETAATVRGRAIVIEATPQVAVIRLKGSRESYEVDWAGVFWLGVKKSAEWKRSQKLKGDKTNGQAVR